MATTTLESFSTFKANLEITDYQEEVVSTRQDRIREILGADLSVNETFLTGSYRRQTLLAAMLEGIWIQPKESGRRLIGFKARMKWRWPLKRGHGWVEFKN